MAKKSKKEAPDSAPAEDKGSNKTNDEDDVEEEEVVYLQVDTGDIIKLKQILDETVANTFLEENYLEASNAGKGKSINLEEDHKWNNIKLIVMTVACVFAMVAQFAPLPFPDSRPVLGSCCAAYFILSGVLQLVTTFVDRDCILITKVMKKSQTSGASMEKNPNLTKYGLRIRTSLPRFSEFYTVQIEYQDLENSPFVVQTWSVGKFFDAEGMFDEYGLEDEVEQLFRRFEAGKFEKKTEKAIPKTIKIKLS
jgi:signal peptidase complex subunit 2